MTPWLAFAKALRDAAQAEKDFQETKHTDAATTLWLAASQMVSLCDRALLAGVAAADAVDYDPAASKDHGEAKLAERDALLVMAEATIERYRTVMESICATGLAMGRSDVDNVVRESWETLKALREHLAGGRGE